MELFRTSAEEGCSTSAEGSRPESVAARRGERQQPPRQHCCPHRGAGSGPTLPREWRCRGLGLGQDRRGEVPIPSAPTRPAAPGAGTQQDPVQLGPRPREAGPGRIAESQGRGVAEPQLGWSQARPHGRPARLQAGRRGQRRRDVPRSRIKSPRRGRGAGGTPRREQSGAAGAAGAGPWSSTSRPPRRWSRR